MPSSLQIHMFPCLSDNYGFIVRDPESGACAAIDTPDPEVYLVEARKQGWNISEIWNTHWHADHAGGNGAIRAATGAQVFAPRDENSRIPDIDHELSGGNRLFLGGIEAQVIATPGHTLGHISFYFPTAKAAFVGDCLFALGCGRLFEGDGRMMWDSLSRLATLPDDTKIYCAHEYTASNLAFALRVDPLNPALLARADEIRARRDQDLPTVPTTLALEKATNPFLRAPEIARALGEDQRADWEAFAEIRIMKDGFRG